jgi:hypothetical protein
MYYHLVYLVCDFHHYFYSEITEITNITKISLAVKRFEIARNAPAVPRSSGTATT